jgi:hypothetical protein
MSHFNIFGSYDEGRSERKTLSIATGVVAAILGLLFFAPRNDPAKVIAGIPCSVLSENAIGSVLESPVRLMPTNGTTCEYVPTDAHAQRTVFVIAHTGPFARDHQSANDPVRVRSGSHWYSIVVVSQQSGGSGHDDESRLARLMSQTTTVAQNR